LAKVVVIGASRGIGLEAVKCALEAGHAVRAFARQADAIALRHPNLETMNGDALSREDVAAAVAGVDAVIQTLGVDLRRATSPRPVKLFSRSTDILIEAMRAAGVGRLITVTGYGAGDSRVRQGSIESFFSRGVLGRAYDDKDRQELAIRHSDLDWVIARPVILTPGPRTGRYRVLTHPADWGPGCITRADVADFLVRQVDDDSHLHTTPVLSA